MCSFPARLQYAIQLTHNIVTESSDNPNDVLVPTESCGYIIEAKEVKASQVTQNEYIEKINSWLF